MFSCTAPSRGHSTLRWNLRHHFIPYVNMLGGVCVDVLPNVQVISVEGMYTAQSKPGCMIEVRAPSTVVAPLA